MIRIYFNRAGGAATALLTLALLTLAGGCAKEVAPEAAVVVPTPPAAVAEGQGAEAMAPPPPPPVTAEKAPEGAVKWAASFAAATKQAKAENKPIMVDFWATWCGWCKRLDSDVYSTVAFARAAKDVVAVKVDVEGAEGEVARKYGASSLPTVLYLTPDGKVLQRIGGYMPAENFVPTVTAAAELYRSIPGVKAKFAADPNDLPAAQKMLEISARLENVAEAESAAARIKTLDPNNQRDTRARALILLGDMYARNEKAEKAATLFEQAAAASKDGGEIAAARRAAAMCYGMQQDMTKASEQLQLIVDAPDAPTEAKQDAQKLLNRIQLQQTGG